MCCRDRWFGLEQEGFGIVFLEAAATGVAQLAGRSGGSDEAVVDGRTGLVVDRPRDSKAVAVALSSLLDDNDLRRRLGKQGAKGGSAVASRLRPARPQVARGDGADEPIRDSGLRAHTGALAELRRSCRQCWPRARGGARLGALRKKEDV